MDIRIFAHSWFSDWNHGNAHFLRGLAAALAARGHQVRVYEAVDGPRGGWSLSHLWEEPGGPAALAQFRRAFPELAPRLYALASGSQPAAHGATPELDALGAAWVGDWRRELAGAELVLAHEWNPPELFAELARQRARLGFRLLLHDTHHRALSLPECLRRLPLAELDGVIAFGESLRRVYEAWGVRRTYTLHEAADTARFQPPPPGGGREWDVVWIGNWGDEERTRELEAYLIEPARALGARTAVYGVRYPAPAQRRLAAAGIAYRGYLANLEAPRAYASARLTVHVPRRWYAGALAGIPTIRVFEALACGAALVSAPWEDRERLFDPGEDFWPAANPRAMVALWEQLLGDEEQRMRLGRRGAATVAARHSCAHRAVELEAICNDLG